MTFEQFCGDTLLKSPDGAIINSADSLMKMANEYGMTLSKLAYVRGFGNSVEVLDQAFMSIQSKIMGVPPSDNLPQNAPLTVEK